MTLRLAAAFVVLALVLCPAALFSGKDETQLTIQVNDAKDRPVPKASITVHFVSGKKLFIKNVRSEWNMKTNSKGIAELPDMPSGKVQLTIIADGYKTYGDEFQISGKEMTHAVKLQRPTGDQYSAHEPTQPPAEKKK